jgi:hypothetical protein
VKRLAVAFGAAVVASSFAHAGASATLRSSGDGLAAFSRAARATDALPARYRLFEARANGGIVASRRVAAAADGRGGTATLYAVRFAHRTCLAFVVSRGVGGTCRDEHLFTPRSSIVAIEAARFFVGVTAPDVARVVVKGAQGKLHSLRPTSDGGFLYRCRAYNGCVSVVTSVSVYDRSGNLLTHENWRHG